MGAILDIWTKFGFIPYSCSEDFQYYKQSRIEFIPYNRILHNSWRYFVFVYDFNIPTQYAFLPNLILESFQNEEGRKEGRKEIICIIFLFLKSDVSSYALSELWFLIMHI